MQSVPAPHNDPRGSLSPQRFVFVLQETPMHSPSFMQVVRHWRESRQVYRPPPQAVITGAGHAPVPVHVAALVNMPLVHDWLRHPVPLS